MELLEIARIGRPHGLRGEVSATLLSDRPERTVVGAVWFLDGERRVIETARPHQNRWIIRFEGLTDRTDAEALNGLVALGEPIEDDDALWVHELIGAEVRTPDGRAWGAVTAVVANPADDLLELTDGTLVPSGFIVDDTGLPDHVVVDVPDGLLEPAD